MTTKPTPGPWIVGGDLIVRAKNAQGYDRAFFSVHAGNTAPMEATTAEESHANARLIAAAPDLLEFVRAFRDAYYEEDGWIDLKSFAKTASDLIAKAEGK